MLFVILFFLLFAVITFYIYTETDYTIISIIILYCLCFLYAISLYILLLDNWQQKSNALMFYCVYSVLLIDPLKQSFLTNNRIAKQIIITMLILHFIGAFVDIANYHQRGIFYK